MIMAPVSETGHAKNVANFQDLIAFCQTYGTAYNPTKENLKIPKLQLLYQEAQDQLNNFKTYKIAFDSATDNRQNTFADLRKLSTRIVNAFAVCGASALAIQDAKSINRKIQGAPPKKKTNPHNPTPPVSNVGTISNSQQSYDRLIDHFSTLIILLKQYTEYTPNENELKIATLETKLADLKTANINQITAFAAYNGAMISRNQTLYNEVTGLVQISREVKLYIKSVFGADSPQYDQVSALDFKDRSN